MNTEKAYFHVFNRMTDLCTLIEDLREGETINVLQLLREIQQEGEEICIED